MNTSISIRTLCCLISLAALSTTAQTYDFEELCALSIADGRLIAELRTAPLFGFGRGRFDVGGVRGSASASWRRTSLSIQSTHSFGPGGADGTLNIQGQPYGIKISHGITGSQPHDVYLEQLDNRGSVSEDSFVLLRVTFSNPSRKVEFRAPDFGTLCQEHPREASMYIGPIFRVLKRGDLFSVEPRFARQVLSEPPPMEELKPQVKGLVTRLDSDNPRERATASAVLLELGLKANELLDTLDRSTLTPQQHAEVEAILHKSYAPTAIQAASIRKDAHFMVDCLYVADPKIRALATDKLRELSDKPLKFELPEDPDELRRSIEKLRDTLSLKK